MFREEGEKPGKRAPGAAVEAREEDGGAARRGVYACRACGAFVAPADAAIPVNGAHLHTFFNPGGFVYAIGCFAAAPGLSPRGGPDASFSWFPGYAWTVAVCAACLAHLGWSYSAPGKTGFFGLIIARLVLSEEGTPG